MKGINDLSTIERLKILKSVRIGCSSESDFDYYLEQYSGELTKTEASRRVDGLLLEDEFLLLCKLMRACHSINGIEQGNSVDNGIKVPDYLALFDINTKLYDPDSKLDKFSAFVEVKTTDKVETKKLGAGFLNKYSAYAALFKLPLLIASRLKLNEKQQWWIIQTKDQFVHNGRKANIECLTNSVGHILLNDCFITTTQNIFIDLEFSSQPEESNIYDPEYGYLKSVTIRSEEKSIVLDRNRFRFNLFLDCFAQKVISVEENNEYVLVTRTIEFMQNQLLSDMLLRANFCILDGNNSRYSSASRLLALLENGKASVLYRDFIEKALSFFNSESMLFMVTKIGDEAQNEKLIGSLLSDG